jgi:hypothetical protein
VSAGAAPAAPAVAAAASAAAASFSLLPSLPSERQLIDRCVAADFFNEYGLYCMHHGNDVQRFMCILGGSDTFDSCVRFMEELSSAQTAGLFRLGVGMPGESHESMMERHEDAIPLVAGFKHLRGPGCNKHAPPRFCDCCGEKEGEPPAGRKLKECSACRQARYCSEECQKLAWKNGHRHKCSKKKTGKEQHAAGAGGTAAAAESSRRRGVSSEEKKQEAPLAAAGAGAGGGGGGGGPAKKGKDGKKQSGRSVSVSEA